MTAFAKTTKEMVLVSARFEPRPAGTLVGKVSEALREAIRSGEFAPGDKLPSEAQLTEHHGVSRTVVREAIALLRNDGLVLPRQGAGVFVLSNGFSPAPPRSLDKSRLSSVLGSRFVSVVSRHSRPDR